MMNKHTKILILIFLLTLGFRLIFTLQTTTLDHEAYFNVRQIESISETGLPIFNDDLSYGGRTFIFIPFYQYFLALFNFVLPLILTLKLIPNIIASTIVIINYLIAKKITKDENISLVCAFISAFIPIFIIETINSSSIYSLIIPLTFLSLYFFMDLKNYLNHFLITSFILTIIHPSSFILIIGLLIYLVLKKLEHLKQNRAEIESILFLTFLSIWINFVLYKKALLSHGLYAVWQNTPQEILNLYFAQTSIIEAVLKIGLIPLIFGIYAIYTYIFRERNKNMHILISIALACFFLVWPKLIHPSIAFMFLGTIFAILFAQGYKHFFNYIKKTKLSKHKTKVIVFFILLFIITSIIPSVYFTIQRINQAPTKKDIQALEWIKENTDKNAVISASLKEGHLITAIAKRKNIADSNFLLIKNPAERYNDIKTIYSTQYKTDAIPVLTKYKVKFLMFSDSTRSEFNTQELKYIYRECFDLVFNDQTKIYMPLCKVSVLR